MRQLNRIKKLREAKGWTQEDLANRLKIDRSQISRYEAGSRGGNLKITTLLSLAKVFGVSPEEILQTSGKKRRVA